MSVPAKSPQPCQISSSSSIGDAGEAHHQYPRILKHIVQERVRSSSADSTGETTAENEQLQAEEWIKEQFPSNLSRCGARPELCEDAQAIKEVHQTTLPLKSDTQVLARELARKSVKEVHTSLSQIRDSMSSTISRYFRIKPLVNYVELPALKPLWKALKHFLTMMEDFEESLANDLRHSDDAVTGYLMYQVRCITEPLVDEFRSILRTWTSLTDEQKERTDCKEKESGLHKIVIHDSNGQLENLRTRIILAEAAILRERSAQQSGIDTPPDLKREESRRKQTLLWVLRTLRPVNLIRKYCIRRTPHST